MELSRVVHMVSGGGAEQIRDLLIDWLQEALSKFPWIWPTAKKANIIPLLLARVRSACHEWQNTASVLYHGLRAIMILCHLCQDYSYCCDVFNTPNHSLLIIVDNARLLQIDKIVGANHIGTVAQSIQFFCIDCVKFMTTPRLDDSQYAMLMGWGIETTWNWLLQTMLALKSLPTTYRPGKPKVGELRYGASHPPSPRDVGISPDQSTEEKRLAYTGTGGNPRSLCPSHLCPTP